MSLEPTTVEQLRWLLAHRNDCLVMSQETPNGHYNFVSPGTLVVGSKDFYDAEPHGDGFRPVWRGGYWQCRGRRGVLNG